MKNQPAAPAAAPGSGSSAPDLLKALPPPVVTRLERVAELGRELGVTVYLVGGIVRDLLLGHPGQDLDLVVEGDGLRFAEELAGRLGGKLRTHPAFLTADLVDAEGHHLDIATARREVYRAPAALPEVAPGSLRDDLFRRDFAVNAMAIRLAPGFQAGAGAALIDPFGGRGDLAARQLRVLHARSFLDDPTRALRGVRLECRLGFRMTEETVRLIEEALAAGVFDRLSGSRLLHELILLLNEPGMALPAVERLAELGVLAALHPRLRLTPGLRERLRAVIVELGWYRAAAEPAVAAQASAAPAPARWAPVATWRLLLLALAAELAASDREALADRLLLAGRERRLVVSAPLRLAEARAALGFAGTIRSGPGTASADAQSSGPGAGRVAPHRIDEALSALAGEELVLLAATCEPAARESVRQYLTRWQGFTLEIRGADLLAAGASPGPVVGRALRATRRARLDGAISAGEELPFALAWLAEHEPRSRRPQSARGLALGCCLAAAPAALAALAALAAITAIWSPAPARAAPLASTPAEPTPLVSVRSLEILRLDCANRLGRREVTLFGNGTVRLRDGPPGKEWMGLAELGPDELEGVLRRLSEEDLEDSVRLAPGVQGDWVEKCMLALELTGKRPRVIHFGRYDSLPLSLSRVVRVAEDLAAKVHDLKGSERLPQDYEARPGDILKRTDGQLFRVVGFTSDKKGVELEGVDEPLALYVLREEMRREFVALVSRPR